MATKAEKRRKRRSNQKRTAENDNTSSNGVTKIGSTNDLRHDGDHDHVTKSSYDETSCSVSANGTTKTESRSNDSSSTVRMEQKSVRGVDTGRSAGSASEVQVQVGGKRGGRKRPREGLSSPHSAIPPTETPQITTGKRKHTPGGKMPKTNAEKAVGTAVRGHAAGKGSASSAVGNGAKGGAGARDVVRNAAAPRLSELQQRMRQKLEGAQFRMINETLYTSESKTALAKFQEEPELFDVVSVSTRYCLETVVKVGHPRAPLRQYHKRSIFRFLPLLLYCTVVLHYIFIAARAHIQKSTTGGETCTGNMPGTPKIDANRFSRRE